ncbi:MAG: sugar ABC transporter permease, partial [Anaerolineae bacterium]|nr:sugar ABC transporter permease [Anaerolineae bacterium]
MAARLRPFANMSASARREAITFYILISPWLLGFIIFIAYPMVRSLYLALTQYQIGREPVFVGFDNFSRLFQDPDFWQSLRVTGLYVLGSVPG